MAVDLKRFLEALLIELNADTPKMREKISQYLLDNKWFYIGINKDNQCIKDHDTQLLKKRIVSFLTTEPGIESMEAIFKQKFPMSHQYFKEFATVNNLEEASQFYLMDFLSYYLEKDIFLYNDRNLEKLIEYATEALSKSHGKELISFSDWLLKKGVTHYRNSYVMTNRYTLEDKNGAYELNDYLQLMFYLFNDDYIQKNNMLYLAAQSKDYADTWLYLALHFICAIRTTDLERIGHPKLSRVPNDILRAVKNGTWTTGEARRTLLSITTRLTYLNITPNKTKRVSNTSQLKFHVPESCQVLIGTLLAICEAHYQIANKEAYESSLIRKISDYERINRYMGEEIGSLFLERNFSSRSANKSYLQAVAMLADDVIEEKSELNIKGYFSPLVKSSATSSLITRVPEVKLFGLAQTKYLRFYTCEVV